MKQSPVFLSPQPKQIIELLEPAIVKRLQNEKRGQGVGKHYKPFLTVQDVPSKGRIHRRPSLTHNRIVHLLSDLELAAFLLFDWQKSVIDIREQFPIPVTDTLDICRQLGIRHPQIKGFLKVVTTDLLIDFKDKTQLAVAVKHSSDLGKERVVDKLQIEKAYWEGRGVQWRLFTEQEVSDGLRENLNWLRPYLDIETASAFKLNATEVDDLMMRLIRSPKAKVSRLCGKLDDTYQFEPGYHIGVLRYAIAQRLIRAPIDKPFHSWCCDELYMLTSLIARGAGHAS